MMRTVCFLGNCQAETLAKFYQRTVARRTGETVRYFSYSYPVAAEGVSFIEQADVVMSQRVDWTPAADAARRNATGRVIEFPMASGAFLWPFGHQDDARVQAADSQIMAGAQPDPQSHGMVQAYRLLKTDRPAAEIIDAYVDLDFGSIVNLDRFHEFVVGRQRLHDEATGFDTVGFVEENLPCAPLFYTLGHFTEPMMRYMVGEVFARLDVAADDIDRIKNLVRRSDLMAGYSHPIHPSVARHFKLSYIDEHTTYLFRSGERLSFRDYVSRIVNRNFNMTLIRGFIAMQGAARSPEALAEVVDLLRQGIAESVGSAAGQLALARMLTQQGRPEEALDAMRHAFELAPDDPDCAIHLSQRLLDAGAAAEADAVLARAVMLSPDDLPLQRHHLTLLSKQRRFEDSLVPGGRAFAIDPADEHVARLLIHALNALQRHAEAEALARAALRWQPRSAAIHHSLSQALWGRRRYAEAVEAQAQAAALEPLSDWHRQRLDDYRARVPAAAAPQPV